MSLLKRYRELLIISALLFGPLLIFLTRGRRPHAPNVVERALLGVSSKLQTGLSASIDAGISVWGRYVWLRGVRAENLTLHDENARLRGEVESLREARAENERLKRLLGYAQTFSAAPIAARIIGINTDPNSHSVRIDRGEAQGVARGMAVVTPDGILGEVQRVSGDSADVLLLSDSRTKVGVRVQRTRSRALAGAEGSEHTLHLQYALKSELLQDGDAVVTAGTDGIFPPGLLVGHLTHISKATQGPFQTAEIIPSVDALKVEEVLVLPHSTQPQLASGAETQKGLGASP